MTVVAGTAVFVTAMGVAASAGDIVDQVVNKVQTTVDTPVVVAPGTGVGDTVNKVVGGTNPGGDVRPPVRGTSPVVGYISIASSNAVGIAPTYQLHGALADPTEWACVGSGTNASYSVKCVPTVAVLPIAYKCDVLHADVNTATAGSTARTTLDCDSDGTGEVATATVSGVGGWDSKWSVDGRAVTAFTCTIDNAAGDWGGGCGDPGVPTVTVG
jgi:hypothetical protein